VYALGGNQFLSDLSAGQLVGPLPSPYRNKTLSAPDYAAILQAQVDELQSFIAQDQAWQAIAQSSRNGTMSELDSDFPPLPPGGGGGTDDFSGGFTCNGKTPGTNDLWLEIKSVSLTNSAANLVIHPPWNVTDGVYELLYCTNLALPISWQWLLRTDPGQTNLTVFNASDPQGFYRLGLPNDLTATDSLGTNFWLAFPFLPAFFPLNLSLCISSALGATGTVTIPGFGITNAFSVAAGAVTNIDIDPAIMMADFDVVQTNGIRITAGQPVSVVAFKWEFQATAAFNCFPTILLGTNYWVMARPSLIDADGCYSQLAIVATEDNTTVDITPSPTANLTNHQSFYQLTNLMQGQTYQIGTSNRDYTSDVTGTWVASDKPIVLLAGASLAFLPDTNTTAANPLVQEQLPVDTWGEQVLALSFAGRTNGDSYRILAACSNTVVTISGLVVTSVNETSGPPPWTVTTSNEVVVVVITNAGQFYDSIVDGPVQFQANHPIQVAQFANGCDFDSPYLFAGDPCEILLPPTGRFLQTNTVFFLPADYITEDFDQLYLNIIVPQSALTNTLVDGSTVAATNFLPIGTSGYYGAQLSLTNDVSAATSHTVTSFQPMEVEVYWFGFEDAYSYLGGLVR
jgi:hypothetical protein